MTTMLRINELDQTIVPTCELDSYTPPNDFLRDLIEQAREHGSAIAEDDEGCEVTAMVWQES